MAISDVDLIARVALTVLLCGLIGFERETRDQAAGVRTHVLVGIGACLFTLAGAYGFQDFNGASASATQASGSAVVRDPSRVAAQVVAGIGFLGAGAIMRQGLSVRGLTTAAALWVVAAIGVAVASGFYVGATVSTLTGLGALIVIRRVRPKIMPHVRTDYVVMDVETTRPKALSRALTVLLGTDAAIVHMDTTSDDDVDSTRLQLHVPAVVDFDAAVEQISKIDGLTVTGLSGNHAPDLNDLTHDD